MIGKGPGMEEQMNEPYNSDESELFRKTLMMIL